MNYLEGIHFDENKLTRTNMPKPVFEELSHQEHLHPEFHAFKYVKTCTTPEDCVYTITGTDIPENETTAKRAKLSITYKKEESGNKYITKTIFSYIEDEGENRMAA